MIGIVCHISEMVCWGNLIYICSMLYNNKNGLYYKRLLNKPKNGVNNVYECTNKKQSGAQECEQRT